MMGFRALLPLPIFLPPLKTLLILEMTRSQGAGSWVGESNGEEDT